MLTPFEKWAESFRGKPAPIYTGLGKKKPKVHEILAEFHGIELFQPNVDTLQRNALYACYQAKFCRDPNTDASAKERAGFIDSHKELPTHFNEVRSVLGYLTQYNGIPGRAMSAAVADADNKWPATQVTPQGSKKREELTSLLRLYLTGLESTKKSPRLYYFRIGPLEVTLSRYRWARKVDIRQIGLMFHLAYLFRYFTAEILPDELDVRDVGQGLLEIYGPMLKGGDPHTELIAPLVNATFGAEAEYQSEDVRDLLNDLNRRTKGAKLPKRPQFIGWDLPT